MDLNNSVTLTPILNPDGTVILQNNAILVQNERTQECTFLEVNEEVMKAYNLTPNEAELNDIDVAVTSYDISNDNEIGECPSGQTSDQTNVPDNETDANEKIWTDENTLLLIRTVGQYDKEFSNSVKKNVWIKVANKCQLVNEKMTPQACDSKWKALKRTYKSVLINNNTSGQRRRHWKYYEVMHEIMYNKPEINPVATCSGSSGLKTSCSDAAASCTDEELFKDGITKESSFTKKRKQKLSDVDRRHKEKMEKLDRFNNILERMLEKM